MTQATLRPNEFIVRVEEDDVRFVFHIRNPHMEHGQDRTYNMSALANLTGFMKAASQLIKRRNPLSNNESNPEHDPG